MDRPRKSVGSDGEGSSDDYGGVYDKSTIGKNVRLVVTIEYGIDAK